MRRYYLTTITGKGTRADPFRPKVADYAGGSDWGMLDLREDCTGVSGLAVAYADTPSLIEAAGVSLLGVDLSVSLAASSKQAFVSALGVDLADSSLPGMLAELLSVKRPGLCHPLQPMSDGKYRIYLGDQVWGEAPPALRSGTIHDNFNRADSDALGTSSEGWSWVERTGDIDIVSNQAYSTTVGNMAEAYANTSDPTSANHYVQAKLYNPGVHGFDAGVAVRMSTSAQTYYAFYSVQEDSAWTMFKFVSGSYTLIASFSTGWALPNGNTLRLEVDGSSLIGKQDGSTKISTTDTSITGNTHAGISSYKPCYWDDFEASDLQAITPKTSADTGAGADAKNTSHPLAQFLQSETGAGAESVLARILAASETGAGIDAGADYPAAALIGAETGAGEESLLARILAASETGTGIDAGADYPAAALAVAEAGAGEESLLARILAASESGLGLEAAVGGNPLAGFLASDTGIGLDAVTELIQSIEKISSDSGLGSDTLAAFLGLRTVFDTGSGVDTLISRLLNTVETGSGVDLSSLLASVIATAETGSALEASLFLPALVSGDAGLGSELSFLLKAILGDDGGRGEDAMKSMIETAGSGSDARLYLRSGQAGMAGKGRRWHRQSGQVSQPSKGVNL